MLITAGDLVHVCATMNVQTGMTAVLIITLFVLDLKNNVVSTRK